MTAKSDRCCDDPRHVLLDLDVNGDFVDPDTGLPVRPAAVEQYLESRLHVPADATDIVVFAHGWRNKPHKAAASGHALSTSLTDAYRQFPHRYPNIDPAWSGLYVTLRWPSVSSPFLPGYRRIRDRAHDMTTRGHAASTLAHLLGYLDAHRTRPGGPPTLRTAGGQYLHCVGHSFGGRFLVEAVQAAADGGPPTLGWAYADPTYPYAVDTLLVFQMAAPPTILADQFPRLLTDAPINGPIVLTYSTADRATGRWHRLAEGQPGIGHSGAQSPAEHITTVQLLEMSKSYERADFKSRIVNVDATWKYRHGRWRPEGAHSDIWHPESIHLLLSLADLAR
ncbi:hypothetical protein [Nocardia asiatica]|uniref:hypothetical protein n=1 Tax=Nocardia asiatica TaxID=209252 RepID=UPI002456F958|nr:hypothetical protein [Nocardia asiatica]